MRTDPGLQLRPTVHVGDMAAAITFYRQLGGEVVHGGPDTEWALMQLGTLQLILVRTGGESRVELTFGATMPLDQLERRLHRAGFPVAEVTTDRDFGEQLEVRTPDGLLIKIGQRYA